jgi:hypothetical protein
MGIVSRKLPSLSRYTVEALAPREGSGCYSLIQDHEAHRIVQQEG